MPMGPDKLQVLIAPVIMCPRPDIEPVMIRHVCVTPPVIAVPRPVASVAGSNALPLATPMRHRVAKPPPGCGSSTRLGISTFLVVTPLRQTDKLRLRPSDPSTATTN